MKVLFEYYKDKTICNSKTFKERVMKEYKITAEQATELYKQIVNYQVKKYGKTLDNYVIVRSSEARTMINAKARRKEKRNQLNLRSGKNV